MADLTLDELRDWHARDRKWSCDDVGTWTRESDEYDAIMGHVRTVWPGSRYGDHPIPATLDAARACMPDGWTWRRNERGWVAFRITYAGPIPGDPVIPDTGDEIRDLLALARLCRIAEGAKP